MADCSNDSQNEVFVRQKFDCIDVFGLDDTQDQILNFTNIVQNEQMIKINPESATFNEAQGETFKMVQARLQLLELKMGLQATEIELLKEAELKTRNEQHSYQLANAKRSELYEQKIQQLESKLSVSVKMNKSVVDGINLLSESLQAGQAQILQQRR